MTLIAKSYQELSHPSVLGVDAALKLCEVFGGTELRVPKHRTDNPELDWVAQLIGDLALERLIAYAGGDRLYIPMQAARLRHERNKRIRDLHAQGMSSAEISRRFTYTAKLCERQVYAILSEQERRAAEDRNFQLVWEEVVL